MSPIQQVQGKQKMTPFLWFDKNCEEAIDYYVKAFNGAPYSKKNSNINFIQRYEKDIETPGAADMEGLILTVEFELSGQTFQALDGGRAAVFEGITDGDRVVTDGAAAIAQVR